MSEDPAGRKTTGAEAVTERGRPVTFRDVFAIREYRAVYSSLLVNWIGDYLARAAITVLVYQQSESVLLAAAAFAVSYLPWIIGGTLLSALAERYPYRRVLISADLYRMVLIGLLLIPHLPILGMLALIFLASLGTPPTQAARSALLPLLVGRDKLPVAVVANATTTQAAQVVGYLAGAALATAISPQVAIVIDVATFALSAALISAGVRPRPAAHTREQRRHLLQESGEGFRLVFGRETLRSMVILVFVLTMFGIVPEGLAAAWAAEANPDGATRGLDQGLIMAAGPIGFVVGGILFTRLVRAPRRDRLIRPLAIAAALLLVPTIAGPPAPLVAILVALSGIAQGAVMPTLNGKFVLMLPHGYRARAFGVVQTGVQLSQFVAVMLTGVLADHFRLPLVVGLWSLGGAVVIALLSARWPSPASFTAEMAAAEATQPEPAQPAAQPAQPAAPPAAAPPARAAQSRPVTVESESEAPPNARGRIPTTSVTPERP
ncbi:MFS transporter [Micromonosporaceae bacterium Da 78-11]